MTTILFYIFGALSLAAALLAVTRKNAVTSAVWLVLMFFGLAANYILMEAYFVAAVQILVYAGAIMVLFLFVIMLLDLRTDVLEETAAPRLPAVGIAAALLFLVGTCAAVYQAGPVFEAGLAGFQDLDGGAKAIGARLFDTWLLAFEVTSILLLGAILGAVILTKRRLT